MISKVYGSVFARGQKKKKKRSKKSNKAPRCAWPRQDHPQGESKKEKKRKEYKEALTRKGDRMRPAPRKWETVGQLQAMPYKDFLKSRYWRDNRIEFLKTAGFKCRECGAIDVELNVHHTSYDHLGMEWLYPHDVRVLCRECHKKVHGLT